MDAESSPVEKMSSLEEQLNPGKPALNKVTTVESVVRKYAQLILFARAAWLQGEKSGEAVAQEIVQGAERMARIFLGQDDTYYALPWNSPHQLGAFIKKQLGWGISEEDCVLTVFLNVAKGLNGTMEDNEQGKTSDELTAKLLEWYIQRVRNLLLGLDINPQIGELKPPKHPLLKVGPTGLLCLFTPQGHEPFETALVQAVPRADRRWDGGLSCWEVQPQHHWTVSLLVHQHFDVKKYANDGFCWPMLLPYGASSGPRYTDAELQDHLAWTVEYSHWRPLLGGNEEFFFHWLYSLWRNCQELDMEVPQWLQSLLKTLPHDPKPRKFAKKHPLLYANVQGDRIMVVLPYASPEFEKELERLVPERDREWNEEQGWWMLGMRCMWIASYLAHHAYDPQAFGRNALAGKGLLPYNADAPLDLEPEELHNYLKQFADPVERAALREDEELFFWDLLTDLKRNCLRHGMEVPAWLENLLRVAPDPSRFK